MPGGLGRLEQFIKDPCCSTFASRSIASDFNFCPWCGTNLKNPQYIYFVNPQEKLLAEEFMNEWYGEVGYRGFAGFRRTEQGAIAECLKDQATSIREGRDKGPVFVHKVDLSNAKGIQPTEEHLSAIVANLGISNISSDRELAQLMFQNKENLLRRKV